LWRFVTSLISLRKSIYSFNGSDVLRSAVKLCFLSCSSLSRDNFPEIIGKYTRGETDIFDKVLDPYEVIPEIPESCVGYIDSFGNIKTTIRDGDHLLSLYKPEQKIEVEINGVTMSATVTTGSFNVQEGDIAFSPGSSGGSKRYWEIFQRGGSAWRAYRKPRAGTKIKITAL